MSRMTLLEMTQNILSAMNSDEVNSIYDTVESQQVAEIIKETYYDLFSDIYIPEHKALFKLDSLGDLDKPNYLKIPTDVSRLTTVKYKNATSGKYYDLCYLDPHTFLDRVLVNVSTDDNVDTITDDSGIVYYIKNDANPTYYTIFDDTYLVCDSYDSAVDASLQATKTLAYGYKEAPWTATDGFYPDIDPLHFPLLLSEAKSVCFINIKEVPNQKEEARSRRHRVNLQYRKWKDKASMDNEFSNRGTNYARNR